MKVAKRAYSSEQKLHKDGVKSLSQVLHGFLGQKESYNKTDMRLLCGIYDDKIEEVDSDEVIIDESELSQETEKMPELFNHSSEQIRNESSEVIKLHQFD